MDNKKYKESRSEVGAAIIEFAILLPLLLLIAAGIVEFGRVIWYYDALTKATRDGARFMSSVPADSLGTLASGNRPSDCNQIGPVAANRLVYCAASSAKILGFAMSNIVVQCDDKDCTNNMSPLPTYIKVKITNYSVNVGQWIPFIAPSGIASWNINLRPETTMRYMQN
jgi:Flp pilus assembly protein TadG